MTPKGVSVEKDSNSQNILKEWFPSLTKIYTFKITELEEKNIVIDDEIEYLKELSKLKVVRTCEEMADYGVNRYVKILVQILPLDGNKSKESRFFLYFFSNWRPLERVHAGLEMY